MAVKPLQEFFELYAAASLTQLKHAQTISSTYQKSGSQEFTNLKQTPLEDTCSIWCILFKNLFDYNEDISLTALRVLRCVFFLGSIFVHDIPKSTKMIFLKQPGTILALPSWRTGGPNL
jgi:hypothetical protein